MATHEEIAELLGAYALDAVDPDEAEAVEDHLATCPRCRDEVSRHREVAASLAFAGAPAPEGLWARIVSELDAEGHDVAKLYPLKPAARPHRFRALSVLGAVAASLILVLAFQVNRQGRDLTRLKRLLPDSGLTSASQAALLDPASVKVRLQSANGAVHVDAVVEPDGTGYLVNSDLPVLTSDRTYQLWGQVGDHLVSLGVLGTHPTIVAFSAAASIQRLAITDERSGGVVVSQQPPVAIGTVGA